MEKTNKQILNESIEDLSKNNFDSSLIVDNKLPFVVSEKLYRVRMPIQEEQSLTEHKRNLIQLDYLQQEGCITRSQLIQKLKDSGVVDIQTLEDAKEQLVKELKKYWFMLATKDSRNSEKIEEYSNEIKRIQDTLQKISIDISTYLSPCLETRLDGFYIKYMTYLCTEEQIGDGWKRVWETFDDFNKADSFLTTNAIAKMTWLLLNRH